MSKLLLLPLLALLVPARADAGCGGLTGKTLEECQQGDAQMRANYFEQRRQAEATPLYFALNGKPFTLNQAQLWDFSRGICHRPRRAVPGAAAEEAQVG